MFWRAVVNFYQQCVRKARSSAIAIRKITHRVNRQTLPKAGRFWLLAHLGLFERMFKQAIAKTLMRGLVLDRVNKFFREFRYVKNLGRVQIFHDLYGGGLFLFVLLSSR